MVPFYLITGFLGSGKTTFLKAVLRTLGRTPKIVVIQNEFAHNGVDGKTLQQAAPGFELVEINNGSVFCVCLLGNFVQSLTQLLDRFQPDVIFLEASGMADPINLAELLQHEKLRGRLMLKQVYTMVDAQNFERGFQMMVRFRHQIMIADTVIVNKADLQPDKLNGIVQKVKEIAPFARCVTTTYGQNVFEGIESGPLREAHPALSVPKMPSGARPTDVQTCVLRTTRTISEENLRAFMKEMVTRCIRLKGFVTLPGGKALAVQSTFETMELEELTSYTGPAELIAFSTHLTSPEFRKLYFSFAHTPGALS